MPAFSAERLPDQALDAPCAELRARGQLLHRGESDSADLAQAPALLAVGHQPKPAAVPADPDRAVPIPQQPAPLTGGNLPDLLDLPDAPRLTGPIRRLAAGHPGRPATARLDATGYRTTIAG